MLAVFIAWINLDLGIKACFINGMDAYIQTWLQFAFPFYIWMIVGVIIYLSRCSITIVKLVGSSAVSVLATLFLLSYAKLQRTVITAFSFTYLQNYYGDGRSLAIWLYDGNALACTIIGVAFATFTSTTPTFTLSPQGYTMSVSRDTQSRREMEGRKG